MNPSKAALPALALCALFIFLSLASCGGASDVVRGVIVEVTDRNLAEIEELVIRDDDGRTWTFATEEALEKNGAHLRLHQVLGQTIEVRFEEREGQFIAVELRD